MKVEFKQSADDEDFYTIILDGKKTNLDLFVFCQDWYKEKGAKVMLMNSNLELSYEIPVEKLCRRVTPSVAKKFVKDNINEIIEWYEKTKESFLRDFPPLMRTKGKTVWIEVDGVVKWQLKIAFHTLKAGFKNFSYSQKPLNRNMIIDKAIKMAEINHPLCFWTKEEIINLKHKGPDEKSSADVLALRINEDIKYNSKTPFFRYQENPELFGLKEDKNIYKHTVTNLRKWLR